VTRIEILPHDDGCREARCGSANRFAAGSATKDYHYLDVLDFLLAFGEPTAD
jgi:hypothetical protein